jgi:hypothetical protein
VLSLSWQIFCDVMIRLLQLAARVITKPEDSSPRKKSSPANTGS